MPNSDQPVIIPDAKTLDGVNIHLGFIAKTLERLELNQVVTNGKIDTIHDQFVTIQSFANFKKDYDEDVNDKEDRIRVLEQSMWKYIGYSSLATLVVSLGSAALIQHFIK